MAKSLKVPFLITSVEQLIISCTLMDLVSTTKILAIHSMRLRSIPARTALLVTASPSATSTSYPVLSVTPTFVEGMSFTSVYCIRDRHILELLGHSFLTK